ncbi:MAG: bidirectional hydrogenase complex protein HoxU [Anaerolineae bacterium]
MSNVVTLIVDEMEVSGLDDETILQVSLDNNIQIPRLCFVEGLSVAGACRLCMVEVQGARGLVAACATRVSEGMVVQTDSERLRKYRRMILEMLFAEGYHICSVCVANGHCELQNLALRLGIDHISLPYLFPDRDVDASHELFGFDPNRCVLCTRCMRVCDEVEGAHTWSVTGRGYESRMITDFATPWGESATCTSCGKCVNVCPTGALFRKGWSVAEMSKRTDFLAWLTEMREQSK